MRIDGEWYLCDDGLERPVIRGEVLARNASWIPALFLVDTGADRTVLSAAVLSLLAFPAGADVERIGGLGGVVNSVPVETQIRLTREGAGKVLFRGRFVGVTALEALDMSVLGRDVTGPFAVIADEPGDVVCLLAQRHRYTIRQT
jgi:hypothetical protein